MILCNKIFRCTDGNVIFYIMFSSLYIRLMKLSSPNLNYLIGTGAVVLYINMYIYLIPSKDITAVSVLCNVS